MATGYLRTLLGERETINLIARQHWFLVFAAILPELLLIVGLIVLGSMLIPLVGPFAVIAFGLAILPLISLSRDMIIWRNHMYVVTTHRVVQVSGVFNKNVIDSSLEKVNDVMMEQSFLGRLFGYGDIEILTASEIGINRFTQIGNPVRFKTAMLNAKSKLGHDTDMPGPSKPKAGGGASSSMERDAMLGQLESLRRHGVLSDEEFEAKKKALAE